MTCVPFANRSWRLRGTEEAATALPPGATATTTADLASPSDDSTSGDGPAGDGSFQSVQKYGARNRAGLDETLAPDLVLASWRCAWDRPLGPADPSGLCSPASSEACVG